MVVRVRNLGIARKSGILSADGNSVTTHASYEHWLVHRSDTGDVRHRLQAPGIVSVGRGAANALVLTHPAVSRDHAAFEWTPDPVSGGMWRITDHGSASGTRVNDVQLVAFQSQPLSPGDRVAIGPMDFHFQRPAPLESQTIIGRAQPRSTERIDALAPAALEAKHLDAVLAIGAAIHAAQDEQAIADAAVDAIARISGFAEVAFVKQLSTDSALVAVASRGPRACHVRLSQSVLARARLGAVVVSDACEAADQHHTLARLSLARVVCVPVELGNRFFGLLYLADGGAFRTPLEPVAALVRSVAAVAALALANMERLRVNAQLEAEQRAMFDGTMHALIGTIDAKDPYTRGHSARVADFAHLLATHAGMNEVDAGRARLCGLVHDIGKIGVSEDVLRKPGKLTDEEFQQIAAHPVIGHDILRGIPQMSDILGGVMHHHERFAGGGYPHGISGERIPLLGRLISIADALDAMTTNRTYRSARPMSVALEEIARCAGTHFDPELAKVILSIDRRKLQAIVGLHVFSAPATLPPHVVSSSEATLACIQPEFTRRTA